MNMSQIWIKYSGMEISTHSATASLRRRVKNVCSTSEAEVQLFRHGLRKCCWLIARYNSFSPASFPLPLPWPSLIKKILFSAVNQKTVVEKKMYGRRVLKRNDIIKGNKQRLPSHYYLICDSQPSVIIKRATLFFQASAVNFKLLFPSHFHST